MEQRYFLPIVLATGSKTVTERWRSLELTRHPTLAE